MNTPNSDDLERQLTELFGQRAATVTRAPSLGFVSEPEDRVRIARPTTSLRATPTLLVAAAVAIVAIAGTVLGFRGFHDWQIGNYRPVYAPVPEPSAITPAPAPFCLSVLPAAERRTTTTGTVAIVRYGWTSDSVTARADAPDGQWASGAAFVGGRMSAGVPVYRLSADFTFRPSPC